MRRKRGERERETDRKTRENPRKLKREEREEKKTTAPPGILDIVLATSGVYIARILLIVAVALSCGCAVAQTRKTAYTSNSAVVSDMCIRS